ncbi:hypothetical protein CNR34_00147 [Pseudomonas phage nickie]|uniref:Uncharacterized protein n=1 Tax=Pseudomonas phage nickie TaxID=2048977 RepID=A0A2H4P7R4_9CAUD|nr:hypothetical protein FDJ16_gp018 [Pseudomonas phage nickie]ATW58080.1 hypothetical protein CNR34_00147 [Pseudomonas phage nickie]
MTEPLTQPAPEQEVPRLQVPEPRNWLDRLWNRCGFLTAEQRLAVHRDADARLHAARLRRLEENGGLDPHDSDDYMQIQINRHYAQEEAKRRSRTIRDLSRLILIAQLPTHDKHQLHHPDDVKLAVEQATRIYDMTKNARIEPLPGARQVPNDPE